MVGPGPRSKEPHEHKPQGVHEFRLCPRLSQPSGCQVLAPMHCGLLVFTKLAILVSGNRVTVSTQRKPWLHELPRKAWGIRLALYEFPRVYARGLDPSETRIIFLLSSAQGFSILVPITTWIPRAHNQHFQKETLHQDGFKDSLGDPTVMPR